MLTVDQLVGRTLGEYKIEQLLGHGQVGAAYMAQQLSQGRKVMITTFNLPEGISAREHGQFAARFAQEKATLLRLTHPNILPVYDCGDQSGYLYLVTAFAKGASFAQVLKQQGRFTPNQTLDLLKQLAVGLNYAHDKGAVHGILSLSNVLISNDLIVQIAGFGLRTMLEVYGNIQKSQLPASLLSASGTFLGSPAYTSPECVQGMPAGTRSDIYALGVMLFELLSGTLPFSGANPADVVLKRLQQPAPSLHSACPDLPQALDLVIDKTLERDPAKRYQRAGDVAAAFERVLTMLEEVEKSSTPRTRQLAQDSQLTLPPTVDWFEEAGNASGKWQLMPPVVTGHMPAIMPSSPAENHSDSIAGVDPFAWWSATSATSRTSPAPGTFAQRSPARPASFNARSRRKPAQQDRRRLVTLIAAGTATAGVLGVSGISFAHFIASLKQSQSQIANMPVTGTTSTTTTTVGNTPSVGPTKGTQKTPTSSKSPTAQPSPTRGPQSSPTSQPTSQPTQQPTPTPSQPPPTPTPTPPSHTGTVIGYTSQSTNSSKNFNNPADGQGSLLLHLSNGNFVACERACTHAGVPVDYDSGSGQLVCPAHGAIFDPLNGFALVSGPGNGPLKSVSIHVNSDGTITTG